MFENSFDTIKAFLTAMVELGIRPEHECFDSGHLGNLDPFLDMGLLKEPLQVSCVMGVIGGIRPTARNLAHMASEVPGGADGPNNWGVIGISRDQWMLIAAALSLGGNVRAGLEDNFYLPNGEMARSNGDLIAQARRMAEDVGRRRRDGAEARERLGGAEAGRGMSRRSSGRQGAGPLAPASRRLLLAAARGLRRRGAEGRGHRHGRLHPLVAALLRGCGRHGQVGAVPVANRGKRSIRINLKEERGREVLLRLAREYDVLLESFRPGVLDRLGVGYERLREENPGLVYCAISGYGQDGPFRDRSGHDMNYLGLSDCSASRARRTGRRSRPAARSRTSAAAR